MFAGLLLLPILVTAADPMPAFIAAEPEAAVYTIDFGLEDGDTLLPGNGNQYFSLQPGRFWRYEGVDQDRLVELELTVLDRIHPVAFTVNGQRSAAITRVVEEREWIDGVLTEIALNYYACCPNSGNVYFFGSDVSLIDGKSNLTREGSWLAGVDGARPGLAMPSLFLVGSRYYHAYAPEVAMDRSENIERGHTIETPVGTFEACIVVKETTEVEDDEDDEVLKIYAPRVGLVADGPLILVDYR